MDLRQVAKTKLMDTDAEPEAAAPAAAAPTAAPTGFDALMALADKQLAQRYRDYGLAAFTGAPTPAAPVGQVSELPSSNGSTGSNCKPPVGQVSDLPSSNGSMASNCKLAPTAVPQPRITPRNALCPCKSGQKFKRCCGKEAPPALNKAA